MISIFSTGNQPHITSVIRPIFSKNPFWILVGNHKSRQWNLCYGLAFPWQRAPLFRTAVRHTPSICDTFHVSVAHMKCPWHFIVLWNIKMPIQCTGKSMCYTWISLLLSAFLLNHSFWAASCIRKFSAEIDADELIILLKNQRKIRWRTTSKYACSAHRRTCLFFWEHHPDTAYPIFI